VKHEKANLKTQDTLDRSPIFYTVQSLDSRMFEYVASLLDDKTVQDEMHHQDTCQATPLLYTTYLNTRLAVENTKKCLKSFANLEIKTATIRSTLDLLSKRRDLSQLSCKMLLTLNGWFIPYLDFLVYIQVGERESNLGVTTVDKLQTDSENLISLLDSKLQEKEKKALTWIHTLWTNVSQQKGGK
jgi:hypothetical protein